MTDETIFDFRLNIFFFNVLMSALFDTWLQFIVSIKYGDIFIDIGILQQKKYCKDSPFYAIYWIRRETVELYTDSFFFLEASWTFRSF